MARLQEKYFKEVLPRLAKHFGRENPHSLPRLKKIVVNMGVGQASQDRKRLEEATGLSILAPGFPAEMVDDEPEALGYEVRPGGPA